MKIYNALAIAGCLGYIKIEKCFKQVNKVKILYKKINVLYSYLKNVLIYLINIIFIVKIKL